MCGLIRQKVDRSLPFVTTNLIETQQQLFRSKGSEPRRDSRPEQHLLVLRMHPETGILIEGMLRWGVIPHGAKSFPEIRPINARVKSIGEKPMFAKPYAKRRCIVPMD